MTNLGLVLSGGGARGAYQAGVLAAIAHIAGKMRLRDPFQIYTGVSAGAINACLLAGNSNDFVEATKNLVALWNHISSDKVFYADLMALSRGGLGWMSEFSGMRKDSGLKSLLSTHPLYSLISETCEFTEIEKKIRAKKLRAVSVSALDYSSISSVTFFQGAADVQPWERGMHRGERAMLTTQHVLASSAIPLLFPAVKIGNRFYGDGCIRNQSPCAPAIYMGAEKLIAIGVRRRQDTWYTYHNKVATENPSLSRVINVLMNAVMMDGLESDVQRIEQINQSYATLTPNERRKVAVKNVDCLWISPSVDFSELAAKRAGELPRMIRYMLRGPGSAEETSELYSYLLFTPTYCKQLVEIGFSDGMKEKERIEKILVEAHLQEREESHSAKNHHNSRTIQ